LPADISSAIQSKQVQALMIVAPISERYLTQIRTFFPRDAKQKPTLLAVDAAGAIAAINRAYESYDLPKGTIRGSPAVPDEDLTTLRLPLYLVAQKKLSDDVVGSLTKAIFDVRRDLTSEFPVLAQIAKPE